MTRTSRCRALPGLASMDVHRPGLYLPLVMTMAAERGSPSAPSRQQAGQRASAPLPRDRAAANKHGVLGVSLIALLQDAPTSPDQSDYLAAASAELIAWSTVWPSLFAV